MIVGKNDGTGSITNRWTKDFTWMNQGSVKRSRCNVVRGKNLVLGIERDNVKLFLKTIGYQPSEVQPTEVNRVRAAGNLGDQPILRFGFVDSSSKFNPRFQSLERCWCKLSFALTNVGQRLLSLIHI